MIQVGKPVIGEAFLGREKEIAEILAYLEMGQSVVLIAPRRFGKTSLVLEIMRRLKAGNTYTGLVDIFSHSSLSSLTQAIVAEVLQNSGLKKAYEEVKGNLTALLKSINLKASIEDFDFILRLEDQAVEDWTKFAESIDFIEDFSQHDHRDMIFAFDEFGDIIKFDKSEEIIKMMRSKIQNQKACTYIFSGSYESVMAKLFVDSKSPFYRLARIINLDYLEFDVLKKHMVAKLKEKNISPDEQLIEDALDFLKCHPYYSQLSLQQMYIYHLRTGKFPELQSLIDIIISIDRAYLEKLWEDISSSREVSMVLKYLSDEREGIYSMAKQKGINAARAIKKLEGQGILYKHEEGYRFYDPIFQYWVQTEISA